ncbi:MAG: PAC2 family protein, partial [Actinobacteria bacterium]|nr:PAC2 family protein [Actinomycetota bacterium]
NPKAALALTRKAVELAGVTAETDDLERATSVYETRVTEMVAADDDVRAYVKLLEDRSDESDREESDAPALPSGDALAAELERFLEERNRGREN